MKSCIFAVAAIVFHVGITIANGAGRGAQVRLTNKGLKYGRILKKFSICVKSGSSQEFYAVIGYSANHAVGNVQRCAYCLHRLSFCNKSGLALFSS